MTDYVKSTNFASKDNLASGNPLKIIKGTEFDTEFNNIATAIATKADSASPALTGTPTAPTASPGTSTTQLATTAFVSGAVTAERSATATVTNKTFESPVLTGTPTAPTAAVNTNTTQVATTAYVVAQIADDAPTKTGTGASGTWGISITGNAATVTTPTVSAGTLYQGEPQVNVFNTTTSYVLKAQYRVYASGTVRVLWELADIAGGAGGSGRIYKNGTAVGVERSVSSSNVATYTDDISVVSGDIIQLYLKISSGGSQIYGTLKGIGTASNTPWPIVATVVV